MRGIVYLQACISVWADIFMHMDCQSYHLSTIRYPLSVQEFRCRIMLQHISRIRYFRWDVQPRRDQFCLLSFAWSYWYGWTDIRINIWEVLLVSEIEMNHQNHRNWQSNSRMILLMKEIFLSKADESLWRKARGPVKWQPVAWNDVHCLFEIVFFILKI